MATILEKISESMSPEIPGVDWETLEQRFGMPREFVVQHSEEGKTPDEIGLFSYDIYLKAALARAELQLSKIEMSFQVKDNPNTRFSEADEAMRAWDEVQREANKVGSKVLSALKSGDEFLGFTNSFKIDRESYRAMISSTYLICLYGVLMHARKLMQLNDFTGREIVESADDITKALNGIAILGEMGALDSLRPTAAGTGVAFTVPVIVVLSVTAVFAVGIICYTILSMHQQGKFNESVRLVCEDAIERGDGESLERCQELLEINRQSGPGADAGKIADAVLKIAIGVSILFLVPKVISWIPEGKGRNRKALT